MQRAIVACALVGVLASCTSAPSGLADDLVVLYGVGDHDAEASLDVHADGRVIAREQRYDALLERRVQLAPAEMDALRGTLAEHRCCSLRSRRKQGVAGEARPSLAIRWIGDDCRVPMWDGEWSADAHGRACLRVVEDLHRRAMRSPLHDGEAPP